MAATVIEMYRIWCITEDVYVCVIADEVPTECPNNAGHEITAATIVCCGECTVNDGTATDLTLPNYKLLRYNEIDLVTDALIAAGFTYDGETFSLTLEAQTNWNALNDQEAEYEWPVDVTTLTNETYSLSAENLDAFWAAHRTAVDGHLDSGRVLKQAVFDAEDEAGVDAVEDSR